MEQLKAVEYRNRQQQATIFASQQQQQSQQASLATVQVQQHPHLQASGQLLVQTTSVPANTSSHLPVQSTSLSQQQQTATVHHTGATQVVLTTATTSPSATVFSGNVPKQQPSIIVTPTNAPASTDPSSQPSQTSAFVSPSSNMEY